MVEHKDKAGTTVWSRVAQEEVATEKNRAGDPRGRRGKLLSKLPSERGNRNLGRKDQKL